MHLKNVKKNIVSLIKDMKTFILLTFVLFTIIIHMTMSELFPGSKLEGRHFFIVVRLQLSPFFPY